MKNKKNVAKQTYNLEKEIHNDCLSCGTNINHPLCPNCISKTFHIWTKKFKEHKILKSKLNPLMRHHNKMQPNSKPCIACHAPTHICPFCFTTHLYNLIKETNLSTEAQAQFLFIFNFDLNHKSYYKELEALGGY